MSDEKEPWKDSAEEIAQLILRYLKPEEIAQLILRYLKPMVEDAERERDRRAAAELEAESNPAPRGAITIPRFPDVLRPLQEYSHDPVPLRVLFAFPNTSEPTVVLEDGSVMTLDRILGQSAPGWVEIAPIPKTAAALKMQREADLEAAIEKAKKF